MNLRVSNIDLAAEGGRQTLSADFGTGKRTKRVWFRTDDGPVSDLADPFLPAALPPAMRRRWDIEIDGPISPRLMEGVQQIQQILAGWYPNFRPVGIDAPEPLDKGDAEPTGVAMFFSGGVDSFYTLRKHRKEITHLIFAHGLDLALSHTQERERAASSVRELAAKLGLELVEVETNMRQFGQPHVGWEQAYCGAALASIALLLAPRFKRVYIAGGVSTEQLAPLGTHPDLDFRWGNGAVELIHDGLEATRFDKIRDIGRWAPARDHLRVCFEKSDSELNCGRCNKCLWTMMVLKATGDLDQIRTFESPLDLRLLRLYPPVQSHQRDRFAAAVALLDERGVEPEYRRFLQDQLDANGRVPWRGRLRRFTDRGRNYLKHRF